ncbi:Immunoglobulin I-set [Trinorchestia longiramus]|nr:Immunoglobulin I-set [Trinorchestia longiramus]
MISMAIYYLLLGDGHWTGQKFLNRLLVRLNDYYVYVADVGTVFTSKTEERTERRAQETTDDESPHPGPSRDQQQPKKTQQTQHKPQHKPRSPKHTREEKFTKSSYQKGPGHSPFCEDTYYSKRDESDDSTDTSRTHRKIEVQSETHTEMMSSKKSEIYRMSSRSPSRSQDFTKPPKTMDKDVTRGDFHVIERKVQGPRDVALMPDFEHVIEPFASSRVLQSKSIQSRPDPSTSRPMQSIPVFQPKLKSTQLVRDVQIDVDKKDTHLEEFPFVVEPPRERKPRGPPPSTPKKFVRGEFRESDYDSEIDDKVRPNDLCCCVLGAHSPPQSVPESNLPHIPTSPRFITPLRSVDAASGDGVRLECVLQIPDDVQQTKSRPLTTTISPSNNINGAFIPTTTSIDGSSFPNTSNVLFPVVSRPIVRWFRDGEELTPHGSHHLQEYRSGVCRLIIPVASEADSGLYSCLVHFPGGGATHTTTTVNVSPPPPPALCRVTRASAAAVDTPRAVQGWVGERDASLCCHRLGFFVLLFE